jgi:hypothetical protein
MFTLSYCEDGPDGACTEWWLEDGGDFDEWEALSGVCVAETDIPFQEALEESMRLAKVYLETGRFQP